MSSLTSVLLMKEDNFQVVAIEWKVRSGMSNWLSERVTKIEINVVLFKGGLGLRMWNNDKYLAQRRFTSNSKRVSDKIFLRF